MILTRAHKSNWKLANKVFLRFLICYFVLYVFSGLTAALWKPLVFWAGDHIFKVPYDFTSKGYGSGDTTFDYLLVFVIFCVSFLGALLWSLIDHKRKSYNQLQYTFLIFLRIVVVFYMFVYGFIKVFHMQMIPPTYTKLMQTVGELSPMGLAWTFMGFSKGYSMFAGGMEVLAGLLLISRRTQTLGALLTIGVMTQVFVMNLCFDIPVKLFSFHLLLMGVLLFLVDSRRFINLLILNKSNPPLTIYPVHSKDATFAIRIAKGILIIIFGGLFFFNNYTRGNKFKVRLQPPLGGVWEVTSFTKNSITQPLHKQSDKVWKHIIVDVKGRALITATDATEVPFIFETDTVAKKIDLRTTKAAPTNLFSYTLDGNYITLEGILEKDTLKIEFYRKTKKDFLLTSRGFRWINETPFNR